MAVSPRKQVAFWGIGLAVFVLVLWLLGDTLLPFFLGAAIAYFLDPVADRLERAGLGRAVATSIIGILVVLVLVLAVLLVVPVIVEQARELVAALPGVVDRVRLLIEAQLPSGGEENEMLRRGLTTIEQHLAEVGPSVLNSVLASGIALLDFLILLVVAPVVAFYLLLDWDRLVGKIDGWLPREHAGTIRRLAREIDEVLAGFVRGQLTVCLILGSYYAVALTVIGLPFGFLIGMVAGLLSFIPYVGAIVGGVLSIGIALVSFWGQWLWIVATWAIFQSGQFVEGNILSPKLIGRSVGLHPVLLILALAVFGRLFGFAGLLIAVPAAAALGVLGRFAVNQYLSSPLYTGRPPGGAP